MSYLVPCPISRMSRNPRVVSIPVSEPLCSMIAFVTRVVPWMPSSTASGPMPLLARSVSMPRFAPIAGSRGVESSFSISTLPSGWATTMSVKVPPTSNPMRSATVGS